MIQCKFPYKAFVRSLEVTVSPGRLELFERLAGGNLEDGLRLYCWNTGLSQALYWPLHAFEISLRNSMADRIADAYGTHPLLPQPILQSEFWNPGKFLNIVGYKNQSVRNCLCGYEGI